MTSILTNILIGEELTNLGYCVIMRKINTKLNCKKNKEKIV